MLQPLDDETEEKFVALSEPTSEITALDVPPPPLTEISVSASAESNDSSAATTEGDATADSAGDSDHVPQKKRHKKMQTANNAISKELTAEQKALVKMNVTRDSTTEGFVKCCYCEKEISSKNVDRWASHLRGCLKAPEEVKLQIQPFRVAQATVPGAAGTTPTGAPSAIHGAAGLASPAPCIGGVHSAASMGSPMPTGLHVGTPSAGQLMTGTMGGIVPPSLTSGFNEVFKVHVSKDYMKFNAAHFIAYKGFREKLHGHNYRVAVTITGAVGHDGYVVDFGEIKKIARVICKDLNESFLVPMNSNVLTISFDGTNVHIVTEDNAKFSFPKSDCSLLPIVHSSAEELSIYISNQIVDAFTVVALLERGVRKVEVSISEAHQQMASYERTILP